jgi:hypothetical protein
MIEFIQKQLETSERLFELMREDHKDRMREIQVWAEASSNLMKKLEERDAIILSMREGSLGHEPGPTSHAILEKIEENKALERRIKILEIQLEHLSKENRYVMDANARLRDENGRLALDLGLKR